MKKICPVCGRVHRNQTPAMECLEAALGFAKLEYFLKGFIPWTVEQTIKQAEEVVQQFT